MMLDSPIVPAAKPMATSRNSRTGRYSFMLPSRSVPGDRDRPAPRLGAPYEATQPPSSHAPTLMVGVQCLQCLGQCGHHFERVADHAVVGNLEDRGIGILV